MQRYIDRADRPQLHASQGRRSLYSAARALAAAHGRSALLVGTAVVSCLQQIRLLRTLTTRYLNEDHALLWMAANDWARLDVREPTFYGQAYGVTFEAIPTALLHALGVAYHVALPTALVGMAMLAWWLLAWAAQRRGMTFAALLAVGAPVLVNIEHWVVVEVIGTGAGRFLAALCAALVLGWPSTRRNVALAVALGGSAAVIDNASALLAVPALTWAAARWLRDKRLWAPACLGLVAPAAWLALNAWYDGKHPDHALHPRWAFSPELYALVDNWRHPDWLLGIQALELYRHGALVPIVIVVALCLALGVQAWRETAAVSCLLILLALLASLPKSLDQLSSLWFPAARMTLTSPMAVWFACSVTLRVVVKRLRRNLSLYPYWPAFRLAALAVIVGAIASSALALKLTWRARIEPIRKAGLADPIMPLRTPEEITSSCDRAMLAATQANTKIVAFPHSRATAYACSALHPELVTIYPQYERRTWILEQLAALPVERMLVWGVGNELCNERRTRRGFSKCTPMADGAAVLLSFKQPGPALSALRAIGYRPRPFGPGCDPNAVETCDWWARQYTKKR
jgi:hypothetical protein